MRSEPRRGSRGSDAGDSGGRSRSTKGAVQIRTRHAHCRQDTDEQAGEDGDRRSVRQDAAIESEIEPDRQVTRKPYRCQRARRPYSQQDTCAAAKHGEQQALGHHLLNEPAPSRAERGANRDLSVTACCSCQQEIRHIHGRDHHDEDDHGEHDGGAERVRSNLIFLGTSQAFRQNSEIEIRVGIRILLREARGQDLHLGLSASRA